MADARRQSCRGPSLILSCQAPTADVGAGNSSSKSIQHTRELWVVTSNHEIRLLYSGRYKCSRDIHFYLAGTLKAAASNMKSTAEAALEGDPEAVGAVAGHTMMAWRELLASKGAGMATKIDDRVEIVQRAASRAEVVSVQETGLVRGGRGGEHFVSPAISNDPLRARQRLSLFETPEVRITMAVPRDAFSLPARVAPANNMPGGGVERVATGPVPAIILHIYEYKPR